MKTDLSHDANHTTWTWKDVGMPTTPCPRSRFKHAACLSGCYVYLFGGKDGRTPLKDFWRYHLGSATWESLDCRGELLPHLEGHSLVTYQRLILIFGGELSDGFQGPPLWILNTDLLHVRKIRSDNDICSGPTGRRDHAAVVYNNIMYVHGGFIDLKGSSAEFWMYSIDEEQWSEVTVRSAETPGGRHGHSMVVARKSLWLFAGMNGLTMKSDVWRFNLTTRTWQRVKCFGSPPPITGHSAHVIDNMMYVVGGETQGELRNDVWCLHLDSLSWRKISTLQSASVMPACTQHASVWIDMKTMKQESDNSRCLSEPFLQSHHESLDVRPMSSPPGAFLTSGQSGLCNKIQPINFNTTICTNDHIPDKHRDYSRHSGKQTVYPGCDGLDHGGLDCDGLDKGKGDRQSLLRPVSAESVRGVDNVVVCLQDEEQCDVNNKHIQYWNKNSKVEIHANSEHFSLNSTKPTFQSFHLDQTKQNQMDSDSFDNSYNAKDQTSGIRNNGNDQTLLHSCIGINGKDQTACINNSTDQTSLHSCTRKTRRSRKSCLTDSSENCPNPSKAIRSYLCDDLYVEDLEMADVADFIGCVKFLNPCQKKVNLNCESIELSDVSSVDMRELCTSDSHCKSTSNLTSYKPADMEISKPQCRSSSMNKVNSCVYNSELLSNHIEHKPSDMEISKPSCKSNNMDEVISHDGNDPLSKHIEQSDMDEALICDTDMCLGNHHICDTSFSSGKSLKLSSDDKHARTNHTNHQLKLSKLVTTGTQTDITECGLRDHRCNNQTFQQFCTKSHDQTSLTLTDGQGLGGRLLVMGGKVTQGHILSKPISLWVAEIS